MDRTALWRRVGSSEYSHVAGDRVGAEGRGALLEQKRVLRSNDQDIERHRREKRGFPLFDFFFVFLCNVRAASSEIDRAQES